MALHSAKFFILQRNLMRVVVVGSQIFLTVTSVHAKHITCPERIIIHCLLASWQSFKLWRVMELVVPEVAVIICSIILVDSIGVTITLVILVKTTAP